MALLGHHDLQGRDAYHAVPHRYGDRSILFVGHHRGEAMNPLSGEVETNGMSVVDITDPTSPVLLHHQPPYGEADNLQHVQVCSGADADRVYLAATSGSRGAELLDVADIRDPFRPREIAYYVPKMTDTTHELCDPDCNTQIQTNNVEVDDRGYIHAVDRAGTGLHILELTGEAREIAGL